MSTKSNRSSGTQHNAKGVTQGVTLVDPVSGLPIAVVEDVDGNKRLAVDVDITAQVGDVHTEIEYHEDSTAIGDPNTDTTLKINPDGSIDSNVEIDAVDGDSILSVGTEDGTPTGTQHTQKIGSEGDLRVKDEEANTTLDSIFTELQQKTEPTDTQPISAVALPLPTGAATASNQTDGSQATKIVNGVNPASVISVASNPTNSDYGLVVNSVIHGKSSAGGGTYVDVKVNPSGTLETNATQSGTWNINNVSGTVSLPTGAATETKQDTGNTSLASIDTKLTNNSSSSGSLSGLTSEIILDTIGYATLTVHVGTNKSYNDTLDDLIFFDASVDGSNYIPFNGKDLYNRLATPISEASYATIFAFSVAGIKKFKISIASPPPMGTTDVSFILDQKVSVLESVIGVITTALPDDASTLSAQNDQLTTLNSIDGKLPNSLGQTSSSGSFPVVIANDQTAIPVSQSGTWNINNITGTVSLPTDASTSSQQTTGNTSLNNIDLTTTAINTKLPSQGTALTASSIPVTMASNQPPITVSGSVSATQSGAWNITNISGVVSLPTGAATESTLSDVKTSVQIMDDWDESDRAKVNLIVGQAGVQGNSGTVSANTQRVVLATDVALPAGNNNIGDVDAIQSGTWTVEDRGQNPTGTAINLPVTGIDAGNSSTTPLTGSATFTGAWKDVSEYSTATVIAFSDKASASDGLKLEYSTDGITVHDDDLYTTPPNNGQQVSVPLVAKYFRVRFTNSGVAQSSFALQTKLHAYTFKSSSHRISNSITTESDAEVTKSVLMLQSGSNVTNVSLGQQTAANSVPVTIASDQSAVSSKIDQTTPGTTNAVSIAQLGANTVATGNGTSSTGTLRVALASDQTTNTNPLNVNTNTLGRTELRFYAVAAAAGTTTTETAITLTKSSGTSATSTGVSFVVTTGKKFRITHFSVATRGNATATIQTTTFNLRVNTAGAVTTSSTPVILSARSATPATASAWDRYVIPLDQGTEIPGDGTLQFGITAAATYTTNAPTWDVTIIGYEY